MSASLSCFLLFFDSDSILENIIIFFSSFFLLVFCIKGSVVTTVELHLTVDSDSTFTIMLSMFFRLRDTHLKYSMRYGRLLWYTARTQMSWTTVRAGTVCCVSPHQEEFPPDTCHFESCSRWEVLILGISPKDYCYFDIAHVRSCSSWGIGSGTMRAFSFFLTSATIADGDTAKYVVPLPLSISLLYIATEQYLLFYTKF